MLGSSRIIYNLIALIILMTIISFMNVRRQLRKNKIRESEFRERQNDLVILKDSYVVNEEIYKKFTDYNLKKQKKRR